MLRICIQNTLQQNIKHKFGFRIWELPTSQFLRFRTGYPNKADSFYRCRCLQRVIIQQATLGVLKKDMQYPYTQSHTPKLRDIYEAFGALPMLLLSWTWSQATFSFRFAAVAVILDEDGHAKSFNILSPGAIGGCALGFFNTFQHLQVSKATGNRATLQITCVSLGDTNNHGPSQTRAGRRGSSWHSGAGWRNDQWTWPSGVQVDFARWREPVCDHYLQICGRPKGRSAPALAVTIEARLFQTCF